LYTADPPEQAVVDRSGMGQGNIAFTVGVQAIGKNQERGPFAIDEEGYLFFNATNGAQGFQACPGAIRGGYSVWLGGVATPAGIEGCIPFAARAVNETVPFECSYN
jgi:hypothetical protein